MFKTEIVVTYPHLTFSSHVLSWSKQHGSYVHLFFISSHLACCFPYTVSLLQRAPLRVTSESSSMFLSHWYFQKANRITLYSHLQSFKNFLVPSSACKVLKDTGYTYLPSYISHMSLHAFLVSPNCLEPHDLSWVTSPTFCCCHSHVLSSSLSYPNSSSETLSKSHISETQLSEGPFLLHYGVS